MVNEQTIRDFHNVTGKRVFTTVDIVEFDEKKPYQKDREGQKNSQEGRNLKSNASDWGIEEIESKRDYKGTTTSVWRIKDDSPLLGEYEESNHSRQ